MAGSIIAVAFEAEEHENWCDHTSTLHIWNINRRDFDPGNAYKALQVILKELQLILLVYARHARVVYIIEGIVLRNRWACTPVKLDKVKEETKKLKDSKEK